MIRKISSICLVLLVCLHFLCSANAQAGLNSWTPIGPAFAVGEGVYQGNYTCSIAFSANFAQNGKIFVGDEEGYIYVKNNGTWTATDLKAITPTLPGSAYWLEALAVAPDDYVFAGSSNGYRVYRSPDSGNNWVNISRFWETEGVPFSAHWQFAISPDFVNDNTIFMVGNHGVARSTDKGNNWFIANSHGFLCIAISPDYSYNPSNSSGKPIFAGGSGLYRSDDHGVNWVEWNGNLPSSPSSNKPNVPSLAISPAFPNDQTFLSRWMEMAFTNPQMVA